MSSGGERQLLPEDKGGGLNRNCSGESQTLTQSKWREQKQGSWHWKCCVTTENNLNSYYSHQALKKENDNSSIINRGPAQGPMAMPGCGRPALQGHGCCEECWRWAGRARAGGALAARLKGSTPALLGQPGCGSQARQGGKGFQILPSPDNMDSAQDATWAHASGTQPHL